MIKFNPALYIIFLGILAICCDQKEKKDPSNLMIVEGSIEGLRKGTLYLQKIRDTLLVNVDSTLVNGIPNFKFRVPIETAERSLTLYLF